MNFTVSTQSPDYYKLYVYNTKLILWSIPICRVAFVNMFSDSCPISMTKWAEKKTEGLCKAGRERGRMVDKAILEIHI